MSEKILSEKIFSIVNQKGGVGKTTTAVNLSTALAAIGKRVLLIDSDPQGNASTSLGIELKDRKCTLYDVITESISIQKGIMNTQIPGLNIIVSTIDLIAAETELMGVAKKEIIMSRKLTDIKSKYDFIFFDCPPSLGVLTINALAACEGLIIPLQCEFLAMEGLANLLNTIKLVKNNLNHKITINGIVLTMHDKRNKLCQSVVDEVKEEFGNIVYETIISRNIKLSEAPSHGKPAIIYDMKCLGSVSYLMLAQEFLKRVSHE